MPMTTQRTPGLRASESALEDLRTEMENRWAELMTLRASPAMWGSESLDGQLAELELWLGRLQRMR